MGFVGGVLLLVSAVSARGDATFYWDSDYGFDNGSGQSTAVISPGESVTWINYDLYGFDVQITIAGGMSFNLANLHGAKVTFPTFTPPGVYPFSGDSAVSTDYGSVVVDVPPTVAITVPTNDAVFAGPATFAIMATSVTAIPGDASDVQFFLGTSDSTNLIEDVASSPFTTGITNLDAGSYTLIAVATDGYGMMATNTITVTVTGGAINLNTPRFVAGQFLFDLTGLVAGKTNIVQVSTNLVTWTPFATNIATSAGMTVTNTPGAAGQFFRLMQLP